VPESIAPLARTPMFDAERGDGNLAGNRCYRLCFFPTQFADVGEPLPTQQITCPRSCDHFGRTIKVMKRAHVEVIEMRMGKKHNFDFGLGHERSAPGQSSAWARE
jgi:hypothetical protein